MIFNKLTSVFDRSKKFLNSTNKDLQAIRSLEEKVAKMSTEQMQKRVTEIKNELKKFVNSISDEQKQSVKKINRREKFPKIEKDLQMKLLEYMPEFYAMLNEQYKRVMGFGYYDVQLVAGILLARGQMLVEQYTGEGKTMTFQLPLALYSLAGRSAHLVTVNEYLTRIGAEYAGHVVSKLGLSVGVIVPGSNSYKFINDDQIETYKGKDALNQRKAQLMKIDAMTGINLIECTKRDAYRCDITYATNNEIGFDYLRDNMARDLQSKVQRELYFCVIDEADSILIDEARTPLIISSTPSDADTEKYSRFAETVKQLDEEIDYLVDHKSRSANLTEEGIVKVEQILGVDNLWDDYTMAYHLENALKAKALFKLDDQYIIRNGEVYIVDEFTGRVLEGRRYSEGLHQAIEAKEGVEIQQESKTFATITFQNFFRLYKVLCGGSGTIMTESEEFYKIYGLDSVVIPTNKPRIRIDNPDRVFKNQESKFAAIVREIKELNEIGRPVLIGTTSVEKSELLSRLLDKEKISHEVLNAKFHEQESKIVANAGKKGAVTVATNMAGRGTDIVIGGGSRGDKAYLEVAELGGLHVIGTERHESRRIDNQLRGRTGRQGEPGSTRFYTAMDDQIMKVLGGDVLGRLMNLIRVPDDMPIELGLISRQIEMAQKRVEAINFDIRKSIVEYDDVMNQHREVFYARRGNLLLKVEQALGRFISSDGTVIDLNLPEYKQMEPDYIEKVNKRKEEVEILAEDTVLDVIEDIVVSYIQEDVKTDSETAAKIVKKLNKYIPLQILNAKLKIDSLQKFIEQEENVGQKIMKAAEDIFEGQMKEFDNEAYSIIKSISLESLDKKWVDHLEIMKDVKDSISLQSYAQKDPLVEYKNIAFRMFESFMRSVNEDIAEKFFRIQKVKVERSLNQNQLATNQEDIADILTGDREMITSNKDSDIGTIRVDSLLKDIDRAVSKRQASLKTNASESESSTSKNLLNKFGRNDKVTVRYSNGNVVKAIKFKKVEEDLKSGKAELISQ